MGGSSYNFQSRSARADSAGFYKKSNDQIFEQNAKREIHATLNPNGVKFRECCDSEAHPNALPVILGLDVTGSMGHIPRLLIQDGLPNMVSRLHEKKLKDAAICFIAIGDHYRDSAPLQISQFESGDAELDLHLTRTWLEGGGGGNGGESYAYAWYFAAKHTKTDQWDKRKKKGFLFTIGDEPCHLDLPITSVREVFGTTAVGTETYHAKDLLKMAQERYHVYHINTNGCSDCMPGWKNLMQENVINVDDYTKIPEVIADIIAQHADSQNLTVDTEPEVADATPGAVSNIIL